MLGFLFGTACLLGLVRVLRGRGCGGFRGRMHGGCGGGYGGYGGGCSGHGGHGGYGGHEGHGRGWGGPGGGWGDGGPRGWGRAGFLRMAFERLRTTPGQERAIGEAMETLFGALREARGKLGGFRDVAGAFRADSFDEGAAARAGIDAEESFKAAREAVLDALRKVHEVLDPKQRAMLADLLESRGRGFPFGGPYRSEGWV